MKITPPKKIEIRTVPVKGMGVFAVEDILKGEVIEIAPVRPFDNVEAQALEREGKTIPQYYFIWDEDNSSRCAAVVFGYGSLYNHSLTPNIDLEKDFENNTITFFALQDIPRDTELMYDYEVEQLWFQPV